MIRLVAVFTCNLIYLYSFGQVKDSSNRRIDTSIRHLIDTPFRRPDSLLIRHRFERLQNNNIFQFFRNAISHGTPDSAAQAAAMNTKSESPSNLTKGK